MHARLIIIRDGAVDSLDIGNCSGSYRRGFNPSSPTVLGQKSETTPLFAPHLLFYYFVYNLLLQHEN
jgi:hypothetical protein